jgi:hypothetical protein
MIPETSWWLLIGWGLFPLWLAAGFADWLCHRAARIESTSGARESALHILLFLLVAVAALLLLLFEVTALTFVLMLLASLAHQAVSLWDTSYSQPRRYISPVEQQVHGFLDLLPLFALTIVAVLEWEALRTPQWHAAFREAPAHAPWALAALAAGLALILEEWWRCLRNAKAQ